MLNNTRDLGGLKTKDGRTIRSGKLFRSGQLFFANEEEKHRLEEQLDLIVDLRTEKEQAEKPDPVLPGVEYRSIPALDFQAPGVTRDERSMQDAMNQLLSNPDNARKYMIGFYEGFVETESVARQFGVFIRLLLTEHDKGILWHCTAGKDRAGFAAVIIEEILGVKREDIFAEYMKTNDFLANEMQSLYEMAKQHTGQVEPQAAQALRYLFTAQEEYLSAAYAKADELYGSFDGYISGCLGIAEEEKERLKEMYLE